MTDEKMLELAAKAEADISQAVGYHAITFTPENLRKFAALVRRDAFEAAAKTCAEEMEPEWGAQDKYNVACSNCADAIRDLAAQEADK